ncbi:TIGR03643 family protein [Pelobium sp.]|nr:TIGR03643 family protein [Pelobium sp.]MDA9555029.1 TIGR03643 family protein [Pelobium sp.]
MKSQFKHLSEQDIDRIIEMAWEDRTPFEAIELQFKLSEQDVIKLMRRELKPSSWRLWRERAHQISHKHLKKRSADIDRFKCTLQRQITLNKISKR